MAGLPKPMSTVDTIKSRRSRLDEAEAEAVGAEEPREDNPQYDKPKPKPKVEPKKGMPKPGLIDKIKKFVTGE